MLHPISADLHSLLTVYYFSFPIASVMCVVSCSVMSGSLWPSWTVVHQTPLSIGFSRQKYRRGLIFSIPGYLLDLGIKTPISCISCIGRFFTTAPLGKSEKLKVTQSCPTLWPYGLHSPWNSPGQYTGVGSLSLLQGIFPTQGLNWVLMHCRQILYQLSHQVSPSILEWVAYPVSSRSSWPRNHTGVPCIAGRFFTNWAIREAHHLESPDSIKNYHKLSGLKQYQFIILHFWSSWGQNKSQWVKINILAEPCSF